MEFVQDFKEFKIYRAVGWDFKATAEMKRTTGVTWENQADFVWWVAMVGERQVGCICMLLKDGKARFRSDVVLKEFWGTGLHDFMYNLRMAEAKELATEVTVFSNLWGRASDVVRGFVPAGVEKKGILYMRLKLPPKIKSWK